MSPEEMKSSYLSTAANEIVDRVALSKEKRAQLEEIEGLIKLLHVSLNSAISAIKKDRRSDKIDEPREVLEIGIARAEALAQQAKLESSAKKILPSWSSTVSTNVKNALDSASVTSVKSASTVGETVGNLFNTPWQTLKAGFDGVKKGASQRIR